MPRQYYLKCISVRITDFRESVCDVMNTETCRRRQPSYDVTLLQYDVTTRRHDDYDDDDVIGGYSGHVAPTPYIKHQSEAKESGHHRTHQSEAKEPGRRRGASSDDVITSGLWSQRKHKLPKTETANSGETVAIGLLCCWVCIISTQLIVSACL